MEGEGLTMAKPKGFEALNDEQPNFSVAPPKDVYIGKPLARVDLLALFRGEQPPPLDCVVTGLKIGSVGLLAGAGGAGKSTLAMQIAVAVALGIDPFDIFLPKPKQGGVVYLSVEDDEEVMNRRLWPLSKLSVLTYPTPHDHYLALNMHFDAVPLSGRSWTPFSWDGVTVTRNAEAVADIVAHVQEMESRTGIKTRLIIFDTLNRLFGSAGLDENNNGQCGGALSVLEEIARELKVAVLVLHHTSKSGNKPDAPGDQGSIRGGSALVDNARWAMLVRTMTLAEAEANGNIGDEYRAWLRADMVKMNYAAPITPFWMKRDINGHLWYESLPEPKPKPEKTPKPKSEPKKSYRKDHGDD